MVKFYKSIAAFSVLVLVGLLVSTRVGLSDEFPLQDGRYVTDKRYCKFNDAQISNKLGDAAGATIRTIKNGAIDYHYEAICKYKDVKVIGRDLLYTRVCSSEGEEYSERKNLVLGKGDTFKDGQATFTRCPGRIKKSASQQQGLSLEDTLAKFRSASTRRRSADDVRSITPSKKPYDGQRLALARPANADRSDTKRYIQKPATVSKQPQRNSKSTSSEKEHAPIGTGYDMSHLTEADFARFKNQVDNFKPIAAASIELFRQLTARSVPQKYHSAVYDKSIYTSLLNTSFAFGGCMLNDLKLVGYYNVSMHLWYLFWIDADSKIVDAALAGGFQPKHMRGISSWIEKVMMYNVSSEIAMKDAFMEQSKIFDQLFQHCKVEIDKDKVFKANLAAKQLEKFRQNKREISQDMSVILKNLQEKNRADLAIVHITYVSDLDDEKNRFISFSSEIDPTHIVLQMWDFSKYPKMLDQLSYRTIGVR